MVEMLRQSAVAEFQPFGSRVGAVVDVRDVTSLAYVRRMVDAQVAVDQFTKPQFNRIPELLDQCQLLPV